MSLFAEVPAAVSDYLVAITIQNRSLAYLRITLTGYVISAGGELATYGLATVGAGEYAGDRLFFLEGFFPLAEASEILPSVHTEQGRIIDIHLIAEDTEGWVVLLDTTADARRQQRLQQKGNDLSLLRQQYARLISRELGQQPSAIARQLPTATREISVLLVKICSLTDYSDRTSPATTLKTLNAYLSIITQIMIEEGGVINHILGETVVVLFGLFPSHQSCAQQAVYAAKRLIRKNQTSAPASKNIAQLDIGVGVTTGSAAAGLVHSHSYQALNAIGSHIQQTLQMIDLIHPSTVLIDLTTFTALDTDKSEFQACPASYRSPGPYDPLRNHTARQQSSAFYRLTLT